MKILSILLRSPSAAKPVAHSQVFTRLASKLVTAVVLLGATVLEALYEVEHSRGDLGRVHTG